MAVRAPKPVPDGMNTVTTQLFFNGNCKQAIDFYKRAFKAQVVGNIAYAQDDKTVIHAMVKIGDTNLMMSDADPGSFGTGPNSHVNASLFMYVDDCDAVFNQAVSAGCKVIHEMMDAFWGDRMGNLKDPYGHYWGIASYKWILTPEEIAKGQEDWIKTLM
jgi:PhnB protein